MMTAVVVSVGEAVVSQIAAAVSANAFHQKFTPERSYADWDLDLSKVDLPELRDSDKLHVDVVTHTTEQAVEASARGKLRYMVPIDIAVRKKFGPDKQDADTGRIDVAEVDALMLLVQQLHVMFTMQRLTDFPYGVWDGENGGTRILVAPHREHLTKLRQFTGLIRVFFRADISI